MSEKTRVHVIPHMHWDREWYFTTEESRILLVNNMKEILERLEADPSYPCYLLDGQTCILEDYFAVCPDQRERVQTLVQQGRLIVGPWYTQTDSIVVGGESIIRNLLYGIKDSVPFGKPMQIGYLPDSFGQSSQLPQIFQGFGFSRAVFWRGCSERLGTDKTEFFWQGPEGSKVLVQILPLGYAIGKYLPSDAEGLKKRLSSYIDVLKKGMSGSSVILPHGHDQMPLQKNIHEVLKTLNSTFPSCEFFLSSYDRAFTEIPVKNLDTIDGELNDGKYMRVHRSISSTRMDIKVLNAQLEYKITNILEPLMSIAYSLGFEYHHGLVEHIWKLLLKNHAHDSIGCCCSDEVHREIKERFLIAEDKVNKLTDFYKRKIADHSPQKEGADKIVLFNLLPQKRKEVAEVSIRLRAQNFRIVDSDGTSIPYTLIEKKELDPGLIDRQIVHYGVYDPFIEYRLRIPVELPSMGYKALYIEKTDGSSSIETSSSLKEMENQYYKISINNNGTLNVFCKALQKQVNGLLVLENGSDDGDEYDYSPLADDYILTSEKIQAKHRIIRQGNEDRASIQLQWKLPKNLQERKQKKSSSETVFHIEVIIKQDDPLIYTNISFNSELEDHRLRVLFPTPYPSSVSFADRQFGLIARPVHDTALDIWEKEKWSEKPVNIYSMMSVVGLEGNNEGVGVFTNGLREYEIIGQDYDTIALTLMRGIGTLGKSDLTYRPGRPSGISLPTPDSQMKGKQSYEFAFSLFKGTKEQCIPLAKRYTTPLHSYNKIPFNAMKLNLEDIVVPDEFSLLSLEGNLELSTLKKTEVSPDLLIRVYNPSDRDHGKGSICCTKGVKEAFLANFNEDIQESINLKANALHLDTIPPCKALSIRICQ